MVTWTRGLAHVSLLTYARDLMKYAVPGAGLLNPGLAAAVLLVSRRVPGAVRANASSEPPVGVLEPD